VGLTVKKVDLVWGTSPPIFQAGSAWILAAIKRVPFLLEIRDLWPAFAVEIGILRHSVLIRAAESFERFLYRKADEIIVNSPGFINHITLRGGRNVSLVPNGADSNMFDPFQKGLQFREFHNLDDKFIALYAGAHGISNNLEIALDAARILCDRPDILILLVGDGKEKPGLLVRAQEMDLRNVKFIQPVPKVEIPDVLAAADVCLGILKPIPLYSTVYPNKVFDYMAAGRAVILAMTGVIRDVIITAQAGIAIEPGNPYALAQAIRYFADHPEEARLMGLNGRKCVQEQFDRSVIGDKLSTIFENLVNSNKV
jgi:glycosyltransferase involved in cell wall biosynthesis